MKAGIHPLYLNSKVICACGNTFETRSTKEVIKLEICSACHPFYTGQQRLVDTAGRVERFKTRFAATQGKTITRKPVKQVAKKIEHVGGAAKRVLTSAPRTDKTEKAGAEKKKPAAPKKEKAA